MTCQKHMQTMTRKRKWLIGIAVATMLGIVALFVAASILARRFEPYIREQAIEYLRKRFDSDVELAALRVHLPKTSPLRLLLTKGSGALARVEGEGISLRHKGRRDVPPMFAMKKFRFEVDLGTLFDTPKTVQSVWLEGMEISIPPKGERPKLGTSSSPEKDGGSQTWVLIKDVTIQDARLVILPKDRKKVPLEFAIHDLRLSSAGMGVAMRYDAALTNPRPPGAIHSVGTLGPWNAEEPGDTPLSGDYTFEKADLGVFAAIAGILNSTGHFEGTLDSIHANGQASVPDFRLKMAGNPVPLVTQFEAVIDGTNGNTILQRVRATLGTTEFTTSGGVIKHERDLRRSISLDVSIPQGDLRDLLRLAVKGTPFMEGQILLQTKIDIPPLVGKVREKLKLDGRFEVQHGKFLRSTTQDKIDDLSRRGQGKPNSEEIDDVVSGMKGTFTLENEVIRFRSLSFRVSGAKVDLKGNYDLQRDALAFNGTLKLQATVSQTMTGWKRWVLRPVDPFFAKENAGTFLRIKVTGTSKAPKFDSDRGNKGPSS
ncbi:MAG: hypothetical protein H6Q86_288 [candidate division NC10 bacterium]|nr:hypothetical protein [candidate division NC10 bacterium]